MIGTATRSGVSLGLHLRATHDKLDAQALEARHTLWWSIFILEHHLSTMTGRASGLEFDSWSVHPPLVLENMTQRADKSPSRHDNLDWGSRIQWSIDQAPLDLQNQRARMKNMAATGNLFFFCLTDLMVISHTASTMVYNSDAKSKGWNEIRRRINLYDTMMTDWRAGLPDSMFFDSPGLLSIAPPNEAFRISLALHYFSARIVLNRPCLPYGRTRRNFKQLDRSPEPMEIVCRDSALAMVSAFPDEPSKKWLYQAPWWNAIHFLVQAIAVILISISSKNVWQKDRSEVHTVGQGDSRFGDFAEHSHLDDVNAAKKALGWLLCIGESDLSARRAFDLCNNCFRRMESKFTGLSDFAKGGPAPRNSPQSVPQHVSQQGHRSPHEKTHQQSRSKFNVSYSQFAGTKGFGFDRRDEDANLHPSAKEAEAFRTAEPFTGTLNADFDMSDFVPSPENVSLDELLQSLV